MNSAIDAESNIATGARTTPTIEMSENQDKFDHDKGQKSAISERRLHWRLSTGFLFFSSIYVQFSKTSP